MDAVLTPVPPWCADIPPTRVSQFHNDIHNCSATLTRQVIGLQSVPTSCLELAGWSLLAGAGWLELAGWSWLAGAGLLALAGWSWLLGDGWLGVAGWSWLAGAGLLELAGCSLAG